MIENNAGWYDKHEASFNEATALAQQVLEPEQQIAQILGERGRIEDDTLRSLADQRQVDQQLNTFKKLVNASDAAPYDELGREDVRLSARLAKISMRMADVIKPLKPEITKMDEKRHILTTHGTIRSKARAKLIENRINELTADAQSPFAEAYKRVDVARNILVGFTEKYSEAWPIPRLITPAQRMEIFDAQHATKAQSETPAQAWEIDLHDATVGVIAQLEEWGLLEDDEIVWGSVSQLSSSLKVGTNRMMDKAAEQDIITKEQVIAGRQAKVSAAQLVCMMLQDKPIYTKAMGSKNRAKKSGQIIDDLIQKHVDGKKTNTK